MMTGKLLIVLICCIFFLLLSLYYDKDMRRTKHKHEYEKVLYYIEDSRGVILFVWEMEKFTLYYH